MAEDETLTMEKEALLNEEAKISKNVLKIVDLKSYNQTPFQTKQEEFRDTCIAIQNIINSKLYRCISGSLEGYFKKRWNVSRAQTYRLYECASVLKLLEGMEIIPHKERICRQLKNSAGLYGPNLQALWSQVIEKAGMSEAQINSFNIEDYWAKNFGPKYHNGTQDTATGKPKGARSSKKKNGKKEKMETSDTEYSDGSEDYAPKRGEVSSATPQFVPVKTGNRDTTQDVDIDSNGIVAHKHRRNTRSAGHSRQNSVNEDGDSSDSYQTFTDNTQKRKRSKSAIQDKWERMEKDWSACQQSMRTLASFGYRVETKIDGVWLQPEILKLYGPGQDDSDTDQPKNSTTLDHLVMAAEWADAGRL